MNTVFSPPTPTTALHFRPDRNLKFLSILILNGQLGRAVLVHKEEAFTHCAIKVVHELLQ